MTIVEKIRDICRARRIPISRLEQDLHFSNGYLNPKKTKEIPSDRLAAIAEYFDVPIENIFLGDAETKEKPTAQSDGLTKAQRELIRMVSGLSDYEVSQTLAFVSGLIAGRKSPGGQE